MDHFHYDVTHAKVSGKVVVKIAPRDAQSRENSNTCNAMVTELVDQITSIMCIIEKTSSDISDKRAFTPTGTPPEHIKRQQCKSKEALFCNIFDFVFIVSHSVRYKTFSRMASLIVRSIFGPVILHASLG